MKNLYTLMGRTTHKTHETLRSYGSRLGKVTVILVFLISALNLSAQVTIGTGTAMAWPINRYYNYSASEHIYLKSEINQAGNICQFALSKQSGDVSIPVSSVSIYFKHVGTTTTSLANGTTTTGGYTLVYSGAFPNNMASGWAAVTLSTPFAYNNVDNLQVLIVCGYEGYTTSYPTYNSTTQSLRRSRYWGSDAAGFVNNSSYLSRSYNRPNAQFNFSCAPPSACSGTPSPGNTVTSSASVASGSTVNLSLSTPPTGAGLTYQWQSSPNNAAPWTNVGTSAATYSPTVSATTWYRCNVTCGANTGTSTPVQVTANYCVPSSTSVDGSGITNVSFGSSPAVNNTTTTEANNYGNYSAQIGAFTQGSSASVSITFNTFAGFSSYDYNTVVFVDWNNDLDFADAGETVWTGLSAASSPAVVTATFTVSALQAPGNYRMRIGAGDDAAPGACTTGATWTCFEDYTLQVTAPCTAPTTQASLITAGSISNNSASLNWTNGNGDGRVVYVNTTNVFTAPTNGSNPTANTTYAGGQQCIFNGTGSGPVTVSGLAAGTTYWVRVYEYCSAGQTYQTASATNNSTSFATAASCVVTGNPATYGNGSWIGYVYNSVSAGGFDSYQGFVTEAETFNRTHATIAAGASASHCSSNSDFFAIRYRMTKNFPAGYYSFTIGGDDGVRLSLDGGATWHTVVNGVGSTNSWVDQGYTTYSSSSAVYLSGNTNLVFEYYENGWGSQSSFSYTYSADPIVPASGNNAYTLCSGTLYDHAGPSANYANNVSGYTVLYPGVAGNFVQLTGNANTESGWDFLRIYNGVGLSGTLLLNGSGSGSIGTITSTSGPLTVQFTSDESTVGTGFALNVACVGPPAITSISASPACQGATVTISGTGFTGVTAVTFNGVNAASYTVNSVTSISAVVPSNGTSGNVVVTNAQGSGLLALTVNSSPAAPTVSVVTSSFCGSGGTTAVSASGSTGTYSWTAIEGSPSLSASTGSTINATVTQTSAIQVVGTGASCPSIPAYVSIGVYPLPGATMSATPNAFCLGTGTTVDVASGLAAGNFSSVSITHAPKTAPASATTLVGGGLIYTIPDLSYSYAGDVDDAGWSGIPVGFTYDFFGTPYTTINIGTNGNVFFGAAPNVTDFTFTTLPSTTEPFNMVAVLAMDNQITEGAIKYWTEGYSPNRRFIVSYEGVKEFGDTKYSTSQAIFYETTGVIEVHVTSSTNADRVKVSGVNNGDGTIGVQALNVTAAITTPVAYRFTPPSNYTTQWYANGVALGAAGTNVFTQTGLTPTATTTYSIDYTNQTTGCSNDPVNAAVPVTVNTLTLATTPTNGDVIWRGATSTDWNTASNWFAHNGTTYAVATAVPSSATRTIIPANQTCVVAQPAVNIVTAGSAKDVIIETGATLTMTTGTLDVNGNFVNNGTFDAGTGKVVFNAAGTVSGNATTFNDVDLNNGVNFGSSLSTINGIMTMNTGSWVNTNAPIYGTSSLLKYNTGGDYGRNLEWSTTSGAGYPNDVQVSNNTTIKYPNTGGAFSTNLGVRRDLTIDAGSNLYMDYGTGNASGSLTVGRNVTSAGDLSLGNQIGGDIYVGGNWTRTTGNFYANNRAVFFNGATGTQTITKTGGETFPYMVVNKASGNVILANNVTTTGGLTLTSGLVEVGVNSLVMGSSTLTGGSSESYVKTASTGVLSRNVAGTSTTFPVGDATYNPATLTNSGTPDLFSVRVIDGSIVTSNNSLDRKWMVDRAGIAGVNVTMRLYWNGASIDESAAFSSSTGSTFLDHYTVVSGTTYGWVGLSGTSGTALGQKYMEASGITTFSPFTVSRFATPLPVELMTLDAQCAGENVIVSWKTASEHNSLNFIVERSEDGTAWSEIQTVAAAGNSNTIMEYAIEDAGAARGVKYYRLIQVDQDGVQKIYGPVLSNCGSDNNIFMSFPNPSDAEITLVFNDNTYTGPSTLTVRDAHGRVVRSIALEIQPGTNSILIPDMELEPAVYYLQLEGDNFKSPVLKHSLR